MGKGNPLEHEEGHKTSTAASSAASVFANSKYEPVLARPTAVLGCGKRVLAGSVT